MPQTVNDLNATSLDLNDNAPEWTDEILESAELTIGGKVVRPATGYFGQNGVVNGRPPLRGRANQLVMRRLDPDILASFASGNLDAGVTQCAVS